MNPRESFAGALASLAAHKLRSSLSMLGMIFGVGAVIAMLAIGAGAERQALAMIESLGLHNVIVKARELKPDEVSEVRKKSPGVAGRDATAVQDAVSGVEFVAPKIVFNPYKVLAPGGKTKARALGVSWRHAELFGLALSEGRFIDAADEALHAQVCILDDGARRDLFGHTAALGQDIKVNDIWLEVIGVLAPAPASPGAGATREILLPFTTALRKFDRDPAKSPLDEIVVRLTPATSSRDAAALIRGLLDRLHAGADDYELVVPEALLEQSRRTQRMFSIVMGCIAGISLLVGGIGIMNIMLATVLERTREIGVRRAVGATRRDIRRQFIIEASLISGIGGAAGVVMGVIIALVIAASAGWPTVVTVFSVVLSFGVSLAVGLSSGLYPAARAAALDPIEALRYE